MKLFYKHFVNGDYEQCLFQLKILDCNNSSPKEHFIIENNRLICEYLTNLIAFADLEKALFTLYENCSLTAKHAVIPVHVPLAILHNCAWITSLRTGQLTTDVSRILNKLITISLIICSGPAVLGNSYTLHEEFDVLLKAQNTMFATNHIAIAIFIEVINIILIKLWASHHDDKNVMSTIYQFTQNFLETSKEMVLLCKIEPDSEAPVCIVDWTGMPTLVSSLNIQNALSFMEFINIISNFSLSDHQLMPSNDDFTGTPLLQALKVYISAFHQHQKGDDIKALEYALKAPSILSEVMQVYFNVLLGRIYSKLHKRHTSIKYFNQALNIEKTNPIAHYCLGRELGKLGQTESMLKSYNNLVKSTKIIKKPLGNSMESMLIDTIHRCWQIPMTSALYSLAAAYGINEMFEEASVIFDELTTDYHVGAILNNATSSMKQLIELPHITTIFHEAATTYLLTGNLTKAETIVKHAIRAYPVAETLNTETDVHGTRDGRWIASILENEFNLKIQKIHEQVYFENYLKYFEEDVIGLLILAEIRRIHQSPDARLTLNQALVLLSKYMIIAQREQVDENRAKMELIAALTSKTCLHVANMMTPSGNFNEVNKMYKRAMACNNGENDVLFHYTTFLINSGKITDAEKLWNTFCRNESPIQSDRLQSLALRYLLRSQITLRQLEELRVQFNKN